jgi:hypothetical protein
MTGARAGVELIWADLGVAWGPVEYYLLSL